MHLKAMVAIQAILEVMQCSWMQESPTPIQYPSGILHYSPGSGHRQGHRSWHGHCNYSQSKYPGKAHQARG